MVTHQDEVNKTVSWLHASEHGCQRNISYVALLHCHRARWSSQQFMAWLVTLTGRAQHSWLWHHVTVVVQYPPCHHGEGGYCLIRSTRATLPSK